MICLLHLRVLDRAAFNKQSVWGSLSLIDSNGELQNLVRSNRWALQITTYNRYFENDLVVAGILMFDCISCSHILINNTAAKCHQNNVLYCQSLSPAMKNLDVQSLQSHVSLEQEQGKGFWYQLTREGNVLEQKKREEQ